MLFFRRFKQIDVVKAKSMMEEEDAVVVDARSSEAYNERHIPGAVFVDKNNLEAFAQATDKSKPLICYCYKGLSSQLVCMALKRKGFANIYNLKGGFDAWSDTYLNR